MKFYTEEEVRFVPSGIPNGLIQTAQNAWTWRQGMGDLMESLGIKLAYYSNYEEDKVVDLSGKQLRAAINTFKGSSIVIWRSDLRKAAISGADVFTDTPFDITLLRFWPQLWVYDRPLEAPKSFQRYGIGEDHLLDATLLLPVNEATMGVGPHDAQLGRLHNKVLLYNLFSYAAPCGCTSMKESVWAEKFKPIFHLSAIGHGEKDIDEDHAISPFIALLNFMNLEIVDTSPQKLPRPFRRRAEREGQRLPEIRVVALRRARHPTMHHNEHTDWSCQWIVRGHWRNQWYPSRQEHYPVFVAPYFKGPDDKPLKESAPTVFDVRR